MRIGLGYDIHRLVPGKGFLLGGSKVHCNLQADAHSDGDVLIHALIDAILGAYSLGDIGTHFPDTDPQYEGVSSLKLLETVLKMIKEDFLISSVDSVVILEEPKVSHLGDEIRERIGRILKAPTDRISVKFKTHERLGPLGESEAIASIAVVLFDEPQHPSSTPHPAEETRDRPPERRTAGYPAPKIEAVQLIPESEFKALRTIHIYTDGASRGNPGPAASAVAITAPDGRLYKVFGRRVGEQTNNYAEYTALVMALQYLIKNRLNDRRILFHLDSELIVKQVQGSYKVKEKTLKPLYAKVTDYLLMIKQFAFKWIPREKNTLADTHCRHLLD